MNVSLQESLYYSPVFTDTSKLSSAEFLGEAILVDSHLLQFIKCGGSEQVLETDQGLYKRIITMKAM